MFLNDLLSKARTVVRLVSLLHRRISTHYLPSPSYPNSKLDTLLSLSHHCSSSVDDLVSALYTPQDPDTLREKLGSVSKAVSQLQDGVLSPPSDEADVVDAMDAMKISNISLGAKKKEKIWITTCVAQIDKAIDSMR